MTKFVVREVEYGADIDGTGPERWAGAVIRSFYDEEEAYDFADYHWRECTVEREEED